MRFTFLGTSSGVPTKTRNLSGLALGFSQSKSWFLIDCGEGTQYQLLYLKYSYKHLDSIFITHVHGDHCYGLPGFLASVNMANRTDSLNIFAPKGVKEFVTETINQTDLQLGYQLNFYKLEKEGRIYKNKNFSVYSIPLSHRIPSFAFKFIEKKVTQKLLAHKLKDMHIPMGPLWGRLKNGQTITLDTGEKICGLDYLAPSVDQGSIIISGDNDNPALLKKHLPGVDVLVHEATYTEKIYKKIGERPMHCTAKKIAEYAESMRIPNLVLTHFSSRFGESADSKTPFRLIEEEAKKYYKGNLYLARDMETYTLDKSRKLIQK